MSLSSSDLFLELSDVPSADEVVRKVAEYGHAIRFPARFNTANAAPPGRIRVTVDGARTDFDYMVMPRETYLGDDPASPVHPDYGDTVIVFAARGDQTSILAMSLVQQAICELTDAQGWWSEGEERFTNAGMIDFCRATINAIKANPAPVHRSRPKASAQEMRLAIKALVLFAAVLVGIYVLSLLVGYFFAPRTVQ